MIDLLIEQAEKLLPSAKDKNLSRAEKLMLPFPLAVFGTLRIIPKDQGNGRLMTRIKPLAHCKGFLPHFVAKGIELHAQENASAPLEIFFYDLEKWREVIRPVDELEGIYQDKIYSGYNRTLVYAKILPDKFEEEEFNKGISWQTRDLKIPNSFWEQFQSVPVWIYSNDSANADAIHFKENPILLEAYYG